jgi:hypothetical protein
MHSISESRLNQWFVCDTCGVHIFVYPDDSRLIQFNLNDAYVIPPGILMLIGKESPL